MSRRWWALAVVFVGLAGFVPYRELLWHLPWGADASKWVMYASTDNHDWWHWATGIKHFVGYRPVTALTFVMNQATTGYEAWGYRGFDLSLHLLAGLLLFGTHRGLTGRNGGFGLLAVAILLGHPATEEVLPYVARRSYLLATVFGLGGLNAFVQGIEVGGRRGAAWSGVAALSIVLAVLSNEVAYVLLPLFPILALHLAPAERRWRALASVLPALLLCGLAIVRRYLVLGVWGGGYQKRYFAIVNHGRPMWRENTDWQPRQIAEACWSYTLEPHSVSGHPALLTGSVASWVLGALMVWGLWYCCVRAVLRYDQRDGRLPAVFGLWMLGATAIVVLSQTWFWRQAYMLLPPLGMLVAVALEDGVAALRARRWLGAIEALPAAAVLVLGLYNGPMLHGMDRSVHTVRIQGTEIVHRLRSVTDDLPGPGRVWMVVPMRASAAHLVRIWGDRFGADRPLEFRLLAHLSKKGAPAGAQASLSGDRELVLDSDLTWSETGQVAVLHPDGLRLPLERLGLRNRKVWVAVVDSDDEWIEAAPPRRGPLAPEPPEEAPESPEDTGSPP